MPEKYECGCGSPNCILHPPKRSISNNLECTCLDTVPDELKYRIIKSIYRREHELVQLRAQVNELTQRITTLMGQPDTPMNAWEQVSQQPTHVVLNARERSCAMCTYGCFLKGPTVPDGTCTHPRKESDTQRNWCCDDFSNSVRSPNERST